MILEGQEITVQDWFWEKIATDAENLAKSIYGDRFKAFGRIPKKGKLLIKQIMSVTEQAYHTYIGWETLPYGEYDTEQWIPKVVVLDDSEKKDDSKATKTELVERKKKMALKFRDLRADEIDVRVAQVTDYNVNLLLYKDARVDMNILDETVGAMNWQKHYSRDNANCIISIWDEGKNQWIEKEDTGTESNMEAEKGLASDSAKRSGFCWGIGRELYTSPEIKVKREQCNIKELSPDRDGKKRFACYDKFEVEDIEIRDKTIVSLSIVNKTKGSRCFTWSKDNKSKVVAEPKKSAPKAPVDPDLAPMTKTEQLEAECALSTKVTLDKAKKAVASRLKIAVEEVKLDSIDDNLFNELVEWIRKNG